MVRRLAGALHNNKGVSAVLKDAEYQHIDGLMRELLQLAPLASPRGAHVFEALAITCADILIDDDRAKVRQTRQPAHRLERQAVTL